MDFNNPLLSLTVPDELTASSGRFSFIFRMLQERVAEDLWCEPLQRMKPALIEFGADNLG